MFDYTRAYKKASFCPPIMPLLPGLQDTSPSSRHHNPDIKSSSTNLTTPCLTTLLYHHHVLNHLPNNPSPSLLLPLHHIRATNLHHSRPLPRPTTSLHPTGNIRADPLLGQRATASLRAVTVSIAEMGVLAHRRLATAAVCGSESV